MEVNASLINFAAGQLSKKFLARTDLPNFYKAGTLLCRNFIPQAQGPAEFRNGTQYILHTRGNAFTALYPFIFNDDQAYALAFSDQKLRFFSDGGVVTTSAGETQHQLLVHFDGVDGVQAYTAESGQVLNFVADAQLDTAQKVFGTASLLLDGTGDYINIANGDEFDFGEEDFTIDFRVRHQTSVSAKTYLGSSSSGMVIIQQSATTMGFYRTWPSAVTFTHSALSVDTWYHIAIVRSGNSAYLFIDGVLEDTQAVTGNYAFNGTYLQIGTYSSGNLPLKGHMDELSIRKGVAVWTADFVIPTAAYASTGLLPITAITQADPGELTVSGHGFAGGEEIYISGVLGMTELNNNYYIVVYVDANTISLTDIDGNAIDTTLYTAYDSAGTIDTIYEVDTPYTEEHLMGLRFAQKADLMYIVHPDYEPRKLTRAGDADWTLARFTRTSDPFTKAVTGITAADPGVVTSAAHGFSDGDIVELDGVGGMVEVNGNKYMVANKAAGTFELADPTTGEDVDTSGFTAYSSPGIVFKSGNMPGATAFYGGRLFYGGTDDDPESFWGSKAPTNAGVVAYDDFTVGAAADDAVTFPISSQNNRADRIQWFSGTSTFLGIGTFGGVYKANGGSDTTPISGKDIGVQVVDYNGCRNLDAIRLSNSIFYVQRGGIVLNSFAYSLMADSYSSKSLNIFSDEITDSGIVQITAQQGTSDILWSVLDNGQLIGMTVKLGEEINAWHSHTFGGTDVKVLSACGEPQPDNRDSLWLVVERTIDGVTRRYMEYMAAEDYPPEPEEYYTGDEEADDLQYRRLLYEAAKQYIRVDSALTYDSLQVTGLTPAATTGSAIVFTADDPIFGATDVGRYITKKAITGEETGVAKIVGYTSTTVVTCDILEDFDSTDTMEIEGWYLSVTSILGLDHLEGETVQVQIDGADGGTAVVTSGAVTLETWGTVIHIGLPYTGRIITMPLDIGAMVGTAQTKITTVNRLGLIVRNTLGVKYGTNPYTLEEMPARDVDEHYNRPPALVTDVLFFNLPDGFNRRKCIHIVQDKPFPCTLQGIVPHVDTTNE